MADELEQERGPRTFEPQSEEKEKAQVAERARATAEVIAQAVNSGGEQELARPVVSLFWSGIAAGLSMGFSFATKGILHAHLPDAEWRVLVSSWGYTVGFLIVILGRQQLFTENTLTVVLPVLNKRTATALLLMLRLWAVVLLTNLAGTLVFAMVAAHSDIFTPETREALGQIGKHAAEGGFWTTVLQGIVAGWLIALMVWLLPEAGPASPFVIMIITYIVAIAGLPHIIAGSTEVAYSAFVGLVSWWEYGAGFLLPTLIGNVIGGVTLVAFLNYGQVRHDS